MRRMRIRSQNSQKAVKARSALVRLPEFGSSISQIRIIRQSGSRSSFVDTSDFRVLPHVLRSYQMVLRRKADETSALHPNGLANDITNPLNPSTTNLRDRQQVFIICLV